jgi:hypothetical protein
MRHLHGCFRNDAKVVRAAETARAEAILGTAPLSPKTGLLNSSMAEGFEIPGRASRGKDCCADLHSHHFEDFTTTEVARRACRHLVIPHRTTSPFCVHGKRKPGHPNMPILHYGWHISRGQEGAKVPGSEYESEAMALWRKSASTIYAPRALNLRALAFAASRGISEPSRCGSLVRRRV